MPQNGFIELLGNKKQKINKIVVKEILLQQDLIIKIMPLIRYKTGDIGIKGPNKCKCRRNIKFLKKLRKSTNYVIDKKGNPVPLAPAIFNYNDMD